MTLRTHHAVAVAAFAVASSILVLGCAPTSVVARDSAMKVPSPAPSPTETAPHTPLTRPAARAESGTAETSEGEARSIAWLKDDPEAAFSRARSEHQLVVVDLWAGWCHTCLSMQEFVLTDQKLPGAGKRYVFLSVDTELAKNAEFLRRFPTSGWPTFYVLSPEGPSVRGRWLGSASPAQFARFLADAERADQRDSKSAASGSEPFALLAAADELASQKRYAEAADRYAEALARAASDWPRAPDVRVARASALLRSSNPGPCVDMALDASFLGPSPPISAADHASYALDCAERLPAADTRKRAAELRIVEKVTPLCETGAAELTPDDRGDACGTLISARQALGDARGAKKAAETRLLVLEAAARDMPDEVALIYDFARSETLLHLDRGEEALKLLERRQAALPSNYNPPHYLARVALKLRRWQLGLSAIDRALELAQGPRRTSLYGVKVDLLVGSGRKREAKLVLEEQLRSLAALPEGQKREEAERTARDRLAKLGFSRAPSP